MAVPASMAPPWRASCKRPGRLSSRSSFTTGIAGIPCGLSLPTLSRWLRQENIGRVTMDKIRHARRAANPGRRAFLGLTAAGLAVPLGAMAPASWRMGRSTSVDALSRSPICRAAAEAVAPGPTPREIRLCWNANSVCHTGIATADLHGYFARHNLKVERINFSGASDQLLELLASGKADAGRRHGAGLAEAARTRLRREADRGASMAGASACSPTSSPVSPALPD